MSLDHGLEVRGMSLTVRLQAGSVLEHLEQNVGQVLTLYRGRFLEAEHLWNQPLRNKLTRRAYLSMVSRNYSLLTPAGKGLERHPNRRLSTPVFWEFFLMCVKKCCLGFFKRLKRLVFWFSSVLQWLLECVIPGHRQPHPPTVFLFFPFS